MGFFDFIGNAINTVSNTVQSAIGNNNPISQVVKTSASNLSNATKTVGNVVNSVVNSNPVFQNAAKVISYTNPLTATVQTVKNVSNIITPKVTTTPIKRTSNITTTPNSVNGQTYHYVATDASGTQKTMTIVDNKTNEINAMGIGGGKFSDYVTADGTIKSQNYEKAKTESEKLAAGYSYYKGNLYSPSEMESIKESGHYDASQYGGNTAKYGNYLSNPTTLGTFIAKGGTKVLDDNIDGVGGYVYDSVSYDKPLEAIRYFGTEYGTVTVPLSELGVSGLFSGSAGAPTASTAPAVQAVTPKTTNKIVNPISDFTADMHDKKISVESAALTQVFSGNINDPAGLAIGAGTIVADTLLPLDLVNVANRLGRGEADSLDWSDYLMAGADLLSIIAIPFTGGLSYAGVRAAKGIGKGVKIVSTAGQPAIMGAAVGGSLYEGAHK